MSQRLWIDSLTHDFITFCFILFWRCWVRMGEIMLWCMCINPQTFNDFISSPVISRGLRHLPLCRLLCGRMLSSSHSVGLLFGRALAACPASLFFCSSPGHVALCTSESVESLISLSSVHLLFIISPFTVIQTIPLLFTRACMCTAEEISGCDLASCCWDYWLLRLLVSWHFGIGDMHFMWQGTLQKLAFVLTFSVQSPCFHSVNQMLFRLFVFSL